MTEITLTVLPIFLNINDMTAIRYAKVEHNQDFQKICCFTNKIIKTMNNQTFCIKHICIIDLSGIINDKSSQFTYLYRLYAVFTLINQLP